MSRRDQGGIATTEQFSYAAESLNSEWVPRAWLLTGNSEIALVDLNSGDSTVVVRLTNRSYGLACGPDGRVYTIADALSSDARMSVYDPATGREYRCRQRLGARGVVGLAFLRGRLFGASCLADLLYGIDTQSGAATVPVKPGIGPVQDIAFDSAGTLFALSGSDLWEAGPASKTAARIGAIRNTEGTPSAVVATSVDALHVVASAHGSHLYSVDKVTLAPSPIGALRFDCVLAGDVAVARQAQTPVGSAFELVEVTGLDKP